MDDVLARLVRGLPEPVAGGGLRPTWPRTSTEIWWGLNLVEVLARPRLRSGPRGRDAGARNCLACGGHRCVQGGNRSPGWEEGSTGLGQMVAALQGLAAEQGARFWSCGGGRFISLSKHVPSPEGMGEGGTSCTISFNLRPFIFVLLAAVVNKISIVPAFPESSTDIY